MARSSEQEVGVRERVLASALELFAAQGYDATSVAQVVAHAGVTKGALYHYFAAKEDLLFEIYHGLLAEQLASLDAIIARRLDPAATLRMIVSSLVETTVEHSLAVTVFSRDASRLDEERWQTLRAEWRRYQDTVRAVIRDAQDAGTFAATASPELVSWTIFGVNTSLPTWFRPDGPKKSSEIATELSEFVLAALAVRETENAR